VSHEILSFVQQALIWAGEDEGSGTNPETNYSEVCHNFPQTFQKNVEAVF
jgi:hypothetical protein